MKNEVRQPRQERSIEKKNRIIKAGYELFSEVGYYGTNTAEIAKRAGVSTGIVYGYFQDKRDILICALEVYIDTVFDPLLREFDKITAPVDFSVILPKFIDLTIKTHKKHAKMHEALHSLASTDEAVNSQFISLEDAITVKIADRLKTIGVEIENPTVIQAIPYDMHVAGKDGKGVSVLRLWSAKAPGLDMALFNQGDYMRAMERNAMAEVISKVLYPSDNHPEGKALRLRQQYFLVSASVQDIVRRHLRVNGTLENFSQKNAIHINDTHPTMAIPELMRILLDECGYGWDDAWNIVTNTMAYTNHTVMSEALECWSEDLVKRLIPRVYEIIKEIDNRFRSYIWETTHDADYVERTAIISGGVVRMANLCVATCHSVNGVSGLHSQILKDSLFNDFYRLMPDKFTNVTNGIAHRRWLCQANPELTAYITELIGDGFIYNADELEKLKKKAAKKKRKKGNGNCNI